MRPSLPVPLMLSKFISSSLAYFLTAGPALIERELISTGSFLVLRSLTSNTMFGVGESESFFLMAF